MLFFFSASVLGAPGQSMLITETLCMHGIAQRAPASHCILLLPFPEGGATASLRNSSRSYKNMQAAYV